MAKNELPFKTSSFFEIAAIYMLSGKKPDEIEVNADFKIGGKVVGVAVYRNVDELPLPEELEPYGKRYRLAYQESRDMVIKEIEKILEEHKNGKQKTD